MRSLLALVALLAGCAPTIPDSAILQVHRSVFIETQNGDDWLVSVSDLDGTVCDEQADARGDYTAAICPVSLEGPVSVDLDTADGQPLGSWYWGDGAEFWVDHEAAEDGLLVLVEPSLGIMVEIEVR